MSFFRENRSGFSLAEVLVILLLVSISLAVSVPIMTSKKSAGVSSNVIDCIMANATDITDNATTNIMNVPTSGGCYAAYHGCEVDDSDACSTLFSYADNEVLGQTANNAWAALKTLRASCDYGGEKACDYFISRCASNSTNCSSPDAKYTLRFYTNLTSSISNEGRSYIEQKGGTYYTWGVSYFTNEIDSVCTARPTSTACVIK